MFLLLLYVVLTPVVSSVIGGGITHIAVSLLFVAVGVYVDAAVVRRFNRRTEPVRQASPLVTAIMGIIGLAAGAGLGIWVGFKFLSEPPASSDLLGGMAFIAAVVVVALCGSFVGLLAGMAVSTSRTDLSHT